MQSAARADASAAAAACLSAAFLPAAIIVTAAVVPAAIIATAAVVLGIIARDTSIEGAQSIKKLNSKVVRGCRGRCTGCQTSCAVCVLAEPGRAPLLHAKAKTASERPSVSPA